MAEDDLSKLRIEKSAQSFRSSKKKKAIIWFSAAVIAILIGVVLWRVFFPPPSVQATTVSLVYPSQAFSVLNASGYVVADRKAAVASKITGRLVAIYVEEGSRVKEDQVIARLEDQDVTAAVEQAKANMQVARHNEEQAKAEFDDASINFHRAKELLARGYIAKSDYDTAETRLEKAKAGMAAAQSSMKAARAALTGAEVNLEYTYIRAPFDSVVLTKNADVGDIVTPFAATSTAKAAVVTIADPDSLQVEADVSESNLSKVKMGQPCEIQLDAFPDVRFPGVVHMIVPTADRTKATVLVKVRFLKKDPRVLPEMSAKVAFLSRPMADREQQPRTAVPKGAIVSRDGKASVYIIRNDRAEEAAVTTGEALGDYIEIRSGAEPGDRVVLYPPKNLHSGSRIRSAEK